MSKYNSYCLGRRGQNIIEYLLLFAIVTIGVVTLLRSDGAVVQKIEEVIGWTIDEAEYIANEY